MIRGVARLRLKHLIHSTLYIADKDMYNIAREEAHLNGIMPPYFEPILR